MGGQSVFTLHDIPAACCMENTSSRSLQPCGTPPHHVSQSLINVSGSCGGLLLGSSFPALSQSGAKPHQNNAFYGVPKSLHQDSLPQGSLHPVCFPHWCSMRVKWLSANLPQTKGKITLLACVPQTSLGSHHRSPSSLPPSKQKNASKNERALPKVFPHLI